MDFGLQNLSVLAYANGFTLWHYKATDCDGVVSPGFFNPAAGMLAAGDLMMVTAAGGARMVCVVPAGDGVKIAFLS